MFLECADGTFGSNCLNNCSNGCVNETCHKIDGRCSFGCKKSFVGPSCVKQGLGF